MARAEVADSVSAKLTKPNPFDLPDSLSNITLAAQEDKQNKKI